MDRARLLDVHRHYPASLLRLAQYNGELAALELPLALVWVAFHAERAAENCASLRPAQRHLQAKRLDDDGQVFRAHRRAQREEERDRMGFL